MNNRTKKVYILISFVLIMVLVGVYYISLMYINKAWVEGVYPLNNDIVIYSDNLSSTVQVGAIAVGDKAYEYIKNGGTRAKLIGEYQNVEAEYTIQTTNKYKHYYFIEMLLTINLSVGKYSFSDIIIENVEGESVTIAKGNINMIVNQPYSEPGIEGLVFGSRTSDSIDFIYVIKNTSSTDLIVTDISGNLNTKKDSHIYKLSPKALNSESINLTEGEEFTYPVTVPSQKEVSFIYSYPIIKNKEESNYYFLNPEFTYTNSENKNRKVYLKEVTTAPLPYMNADEVLKLIKSQK